MYTNTEINNARQRELVPINYKKKEKYGFKKSQEKTTIRTFATAKNFNDHKRI